MKVYLDVGNTAAKWRQGCGTDDGRIGGCDHGRDWRELARQMRDGLAGRPESLAVASVAGRDADVALAQALRDTFSLDPWFYYSPAADLGVSNRYEEPGRLGVDRWLALLEAHHVLGGAAIIVDCGSALTLDAVSADGRHVGGYIVPGLRMLEKSLLANTGSVRFEPARSWSSLAPGASTTECVHNGVMRMTVAFITETAVALQQAVQDTCPIIMTGGDAARVAPWLEMPVSVKPELVLDGLERVAANRKIGG